MYDFHDYFAAENSGRPYTKPGEELEDYLRLLDLQLENYLEYKGMGSKQKLFSRGLVITEDELTSYFDLPPYFRERDICNPELSAEVNAAISYIDKRVKATQILLSQGSESADSPSSSFPGIHADSLDLLRVEYLKTVFDLDLTELMAILLALAVEIDRRYERIFGFLQDNISKGTPTLGLLYTLTSRILQRDGAEEMMPRPLDERMYTYFFIRGENSDHLDSSLVLQPLVKKLLMGIQDEENSHTAAFFRFEEETDIPVFFEKTAKELEYILSKESNSAKGNTNGTAKKAVYLANEDEDTVLHLLFHLCSIRRENLYVLDLQQLTNIQDNERSLCLSELFLRMKLYNGRLIVRYISEDSNEHQEQVNQRSQALQMLNNIFRINADRYVFLFGQREEPGELAALYIPSVKIPEVSVTLRTAIWEHFLSPEKGIKLSKDVDIPDIADFYEISYGSIRKAIGHAVATAHTRRGSVINRKMLLDSLRQLNQVDFSGLATYVNPVYTWKDITITDHQKAILQTACNRYRLRNRIGEGWGLKSKNAYGNGVSILLYGPPGTGKTMAAQVLANELELPLYRVDISQIASKYIGETEKNMAIIFKAASKANVILFFDEADSLFSKRTEVSDSHDKYANNETAFLLQKIEEYNGLSILATNYYNNFDDAFVRRITYAVHMESPDKETRYMLWTTILPKSAKMARGIDFHFLADKFDLSGSNIKAILFNAAYMAGADGKAIGAEHIVRAMQYEFNKLGKLVHSSDFGKYGIYLK